MSHEVSATWPNHVAWLYSVGSPKKHDVSVVRAVDRYQQVAACEYSGLMMHAKLYNGKVRARTPQTWVGGVW